MTQKGMFDGIRVVMRITCSFQEKSPDGCEFSQYFIRIGSNKWKVFYRKSTIHSTKGKILYCNGEYQLCSGEEDTVAYSGESYFCPKLNLSRQCGSCGLYAEDNGHSYCGEKLREFSDSQLREIIERSTLVNVRGGILTVDSTQLPVSHTQIFA